jgi:hypothetical protein
MLDSSSLYNINRSVSVLDPDSHLLGSYLNRKQPNTYRNVNVFISTINLVTSNVCETLAHRISSLYTQNPDEVMWVDSCGENSLHRLCQLARFRNDKDKQKYELILYVQKLLIITSESHAASALNNWNETPLHLFLSHCGFVVEDFAQNLSTPDYHLNFINELLWSFPRSIMTRNYEMALPLHEACKLSQLGNTNYPHKDVSPFRLLESDNSNRNRIHLEIIKVLVKSYPYALFLKDIKGKTPLHHAVESLSCSAEVVMYLLHEMETLYTSYSKSYDNSSKIRIDFDLRIILHELFDSFNLNRRVSEELLINLNRYKRVGEWTLAKHLYLMANVDRFSLEKVRIWKKLLAIICKLYHGSVAHTKFPLHACIFSNAPLSILNILLVTHQSDLRRVSTDGETPLTLLLSSKNKTCDFIKEISLALLEADRYCALVPNTHQRWPLHIALERKLGWSDTTRKLFLCNKAAAAVKDPKTQLWSFMIAASVSNTQPSCSKDNINSIYSLLRAAPSVLLTCGY